MMEAVEAETGEISIFDKMLNTDNTCQQGHQHHFIMHPEMPPPDIIHDGAMLGMNTLIQPGVGFRDEMVPLKQDGGMPGMMNTSIPHPGKEHFRHEDTTPSNIHDGAMPAGMMNTPIPHPGKEHFRHENTAPSKHDGAMVEMKTLTNLDGGDLVHYHHHHENTAL